MSELRERLQQVEEEIAAACARSGRPRSEVTLVAVSKTFPAEVVRAGYDAGMRDFGENRVQEILNKAPVTEDLDLRWHMIGQLQTNKVKAVLPHIFLLHSLDRHSLLDELKKRLTRELPVLLQVNTTDEASKSGAAPTEVDALLEAALGDPHLRVEGLMTIGPLGGTESDNRRAFALLRDLRDRLQTTFGHPLPSLSMGMSGDFGQAIEEGATHVRVGSRLFGPRG